MKTFCNEKIGITLFNGFLLFFSFFLWPLNGLSEEIVVRSPEKNITLARAAAVLLEITADRDSVTEAGTNITYTYTVANQGDEVLRGIIVNDNNFSEIPLPSDTLAPNNSLSGMKSYRVTQDDIDAGDDFVNYATVQTTEGATDSDSLMVAVIKKTSVLLEKTADTPDVSSTDDIITYFYTVTNDGNVTLSSVTVEDDMLETITLDKTTLAPKEVAKGTETYTVQQSDLNSGNEIVNEATVTTAEGATSSDTATVSVIADASVEIVKTANQPSVSSANEIITYSYTVTNVGSVTLNNVTVKDDMLEAITLNRTILEPKQVAEGRATYEVQQSDIDSGNDIVNNATVTTAEGATNSDTATVSVLADASVEIVKTANQSSVSSPGVIITYSYTVTNNGSVTLNDVTVEDDMLETVALDKTTLAPKEVARGTATYEVQQSDIDSGNDIVNKATVTTVEGVTAFDTVTVSVIAVASVEIVKTANKSRVSSAGEFITYSYTVTNDGDVTLNNVTVEDDMLGPITMNKTTIAPEQFAEGTATYEVQQTDIDSGNEIVNEAIVTTAEKATNSDTATVQINKQSNLSVVKTATTESYSSVGDVLNYTIVVENNGNTTLGSVTVNDPLTGLSETLTNFAPGATNTYNQSYRVQQSDLNAGSVTNTVTASDGGVITVSDTALVNAAVSPDISITKTASPNSYDTLEDEIIYTIEVENTGNVNLNNVVVTDQMLDLDQTIGTLTPGAIQTFTRTYTITQVDLNNGSLLNTAYVSGNAPNGEVVSDEVQVSVTASQSPEVVVTKTASPVTYDSVGDEITYAINVRNAGNVILTDIAVTDPLTGMDEFIAVLAPGESSPFTQSVAINQAHLDAGSLTNTVTASGNGPNNSEVNDTDSAIVLAGQNPGLAVSKSALQENYKAVGDQLEYTIEVENTGNVTLTDINVNDALTQMSESINSLSPGAAQSFSATYIVRQADLEEGVVVNTVLVTTTFGSQTIEADAEAVVSALFPPVANDDISADHITGNSAVIDILSNDLLNDGSAATPGQVTVDLNQQVSGIQTRLEVQGEGTWNYNSQSGELTFTPLSGFTTDPTSVSYLLTETSTGLTDTASVTVDYNEGEPFAFNDVSTDNVPGQPVAINIVSNDKLSDGSPATIQKVTIDIDVSQDGVQNQKEVTGEGSWVFNPETGEIVFTPLPGFSTDPTPLTYTLTENLTNLSDEGTVVIGYDEQAPIAADDVSSGNVPGDEVTVNILENDVLGDGTEALPDLVTIDIDLTRAGIQVELELSGEGLWSLDALTGEITFIPQPGFTGNPEPLTYRITDLLTGLNDDAVVTVIYNEEAPVAVDDSSDNIDPGTEVTISILDNDLLSDGSPALPELISIDLDPDTEGVQHEMVINGQGTWLYNEVNGVLLFTPQTNFYDDPSPITYLLCSIWNPQLCSEAEVVIDYRQEASMAAIGLVKNGTYNSDDEIINYTFEVRNTGSLPVWNITIDDEPIGISNLQIVPDTLQPGAAGTATASYQVNQADKNAGNVTNSAVAAGIIFNGEQISDISGNTVEDDEPTVTPLLQVPSILVEKQSLLVLPEAILNQPVEFRIVVTNNGNVVLDDVTVTDPLTGFEQEVGQLLPGEIVDYLTEYLVQPGDEMEGEFKNTAIATAIAPGGTQISDSSTVFVDVEQCGMVIPNGFSPNDDGIQDMWKIQCLEKYPEARVEIFNRWGNRVYEKENYGNTDVHGIADAWWDGYSTNKRTFGSGKLPTGTYYYILYLQEGQEPLNGYIFLNR